MILIGLLLLILGVVLGIHILYVVGGLLLVVGLVLIVAGSLGHGLGGRRHYW